MPFRNELSITIPTGAGVGESRIVIGTQIPQVLIDILDATSAIIFYSGYQNTDDEYYFIVNGAVTGTSYPVSYGYVRDGNTVRLVFQKTINLGSDDAALFIDPNGVITIGGVSADAVQIGHGAQTLNLLAGEWAIDGEMIWLNDDASETDEIALANWTSNFIKLYRRNKVVFCRWSVTRAVANLAANVNSTLFTMDAKYRPIGTFRVACEGNSNTGVFGVASIGSDGNVIIDTHPGIAIGQATTGWACWIVD